MSGDNNIPNGWVETTLGEVCFFVNNKIATSKISINNYISTENLLANKLGVTTASSLPTIPKVNNYEKGDTLFSNIRTYFKKVWFANKNGGSSNDVLIFRTLDEKQLHNKFLFYYISSDKFIDFTVKSAKGTKMPRGDKNAIISSSFIIPKDITEQKAIAKILTAFDDKIELLQAQNKTLEATAQTIFKEWFLPSRQAGGKYQIGDLPAEASAQADALPEGWRVGKLGEVVESTSGGTPSRKNDSFYINGKYNWVKSKELKGTFIIETEEKITEEALEKSSAKLFPSNSILIAMYGNTVGEYALVSKPMTCNQAVCALIPNEKIPFTYLFFLIKSLKIEFINNAIGSAQQNISQVLIKNTDIIYSELLISKFHSVSKPLMDKVLLNVEQIQTLKQTRDTLLPKLMSGQIRVDLSACNAQADEFKKDSLC